MHRRRKQIQTFSITSICLCLGFFLAAPIEANTKTDPMAAQNVQHGKALFQQSCAVCHGASATGGEGPNLLESDLVNDQEKFGNAAALVIQGGRLDRGMPAFPTMTDANISDILAFLHASVEIADSESSGSSRASSLKRLLTGNAAAGKSYFYGQGKCSTCHSPTGDLSGIANKYQPEELQTRFLYPPDANITATVSLPSGEKVQGKLLHLDAFYIAILNKDGWYRSWRLQNVKVQVGDPLREHGELLRNYKNKDVHDVFSYLETLK
jgi:cytochrome c oxidase cbb3-type subunit 3